MKLIMKKVPYLIGYHLAWYVLRDGKDVGRVNIGEGESYVFEGVDDVGDHYNFTVEELKQIIEFIENMSDFEKKHFIEFPVEVTPADELL